MSNPIYTFDFRDFPEYDKAKQNDFFQKRFKFNNNSNIMQEIKNHSTVFFIMETPHDFIDVKFVKKYDIRKIYKVTSNNCAFRKEVVETYLKDEFGENFGGFYSDKQQNGRVWKSADNVGKHVDLNGEYWGYKILPYRGKIPEDDKQWKQLRERLTKQYNEDYTVYIALCFKKR